MIWKWKKRIKLNHRQQVKLSNETDQHAMLEHKDDANRGVGDGGAVQ